VHHPRCTRHIPEEQQQLVPPSDHTPGDQLAGRLVEDRKRRLVPAQVLARRLALRARLRENPRGKLHQEVTALPEA
jgi:hypothetical protein